MKKYNNHFKITTNFIFNFVIKKDSIIINYDIMY